MEFLELLPAYEEEIGLQDGQWPKPNTTHTHRWASTLASRIVPIELSIAEEVLFPSLFPIYNRPINLSNVVQWIARQMKQRKQRHM